MMRLNNDVNIKIGSGVFVITFYIEAIMGAESISNMKIIIENGVQKPTIAEKGKKYLLLLLFGFSS